MWTGRRPAQWAVLLGILLSVSCRPGNEPKAEQDAPTAAWWYSMNFEPTSATIHGIDVRAIDKGWRRATALDTRLLEGRISQNDVQQFRASPLSFSLLADLDGDGASEEFFVGVFENEEGGKGRFVVVARDGRAVQLFEEGGTTGFSALLRDEDLIRWYKCMECGEFESIKWSDGAYVLE